ncbi:hypothetical protein JCM9279_007351 [Rhodotorula babjevae]
MPPRPKASGSASSATAPVWTHDDDEALTAALEHGDGQLSWQEVATLAFPDGKFSKTECNSRWTSLSRPKTIKGSWTAAEDAKLVELVDEFGSEKWVIISSQMGSRTGKQCRERWHNHLNPNIKKSDWSPEEDALIRDLHAKIGPKWAEMAKHLPGRPDNSIKNYWNARQAREKRDRSKSMTQLPMAHGGDKVKAAKAKAAAAASAALEAVASRQPATPAPAMSRSSSSASLNNTRFTPYARSSPMSKSRSESVSSLGAFSSVRSSASIETLASSPSSQMSPFTPTHSARSQSMVGIAGSTAPHARRISQHAFPQEQLGTLAAAANNGDDLDILAAPRPPFFPSHGSSRSIGTADRCRRPHANSSPPAPFGLYTYASPPDELPTPPPQFLQPMQQQHDDVMSSWPSDAVVQGSGLVPSDDGQPSLSRLYTDSDVSHDSSAASPYDEYSSAPSSAFYSAPGPDSRFASPTDDADPMQHAFFGAGPLSFDPSAQHVAFDTGAAGVAGPYIHPAHLTTLDETYAYPASQDSTPLVGSSSGGFDPYSMYDLSQGYHDDGSATPGSAPSSVAASPHDSTIGVTVDAVTGLVYSAGPSTAGSSSEVHPAFGAFGPASGGGEDGGAGSGYMGSSATSAGLGQQSQPSFAPADGASYVFDPSPLPAASPMEGTAPRPSLARQHTAPAAFAFPPPRQPLAAAPMRRPAPLQLPSSSSSSSLGSRSSHSHRHTPSLPNVPTPTHLSFGLDQTTPTAASLKGSLPPSASFPGRHAGHGHSLSNSLSGSLSGSISASSLLSASGSSARTVHSHGQHAHARHRSLSRPTPYGGVASLRASTGTGSSAGALAAPFDMSSSTAAAAPALSRSGSRAGLASEPMSKVYSSPLSEIAGRWEGLSLTSPSSGAAAGGVAAPWLARSGSMGRAGPLGALIAEEAARAAASGGGGGAPPVSLAHPTTGLMRVDENGRASLPL